MNGRLAYRINDDTRIDLVGFNLLNSKHSVTDYAVDSYTPPDGSGGLGAPLPDGKYRVFHPIEPSSFRVMLITRY